MADVVDTATRSRMMSGIRGRNTRPELAVRKALHAAGFRFRLHDRRLPGKPDIVLPRHRVAIFVHGCFWHRHEGCRYTTTPTTRPEFWQTKFDANQARDGRASRQLQNAGWRVAIVWECAVRNRFPSAIAELVAWIVSADCRIAIGEAGHRVGP